MNAWNVSRDLARTRARLRLAGRSRAPWSVPACSPPSAWRPAMSGSATSVPEGTNRHLKPEGFRCLDGSMETAARPGSWTERNAHGFRKCPAEPWRHPGHRHVPGGKRPEFGATRTSHPRLHDLVQRHDGSRSEVRRAPASGHFAPCIRRAARRNMQKGSLPNRGRHGKVSSLKFTAAASAAMQPPTKLSAPAPRVARSGRRWTGCLPDTPFVHRSARPSPLQARAEDRNGLQTDSGPTEHLSGPKC